MEPKEPRSPSLEHALRQLDPRAENRTKRVELWRQELLKHHGAIDLQLERRTPEELEDLQTALGSIVLNYLWEYTQQGEPLKEKIPHDELFWDRLFKELFEYFGERQHQFHGAIQVRRTTEKETPFTPLEWYLTYFKIISKRISGKNASVPVMLDLNNFGTKLLRVLTERYLGVYDEPLEEEAYKTFTDTPTLERLLADWQFNAQLPAVTLRDLILDKSADVDAIVAQLYTPHKPSRAGIPYEDLGQMHRPFDPRFFIIDRDTGGFGIQPAVVEALRGVIEKSDSVRVQRNCPAVYMREFHEMWRWLVALVSYQRYNTPYPSYADRAPSRLPEALRQEIQQDLRIAVHPYVHLVPEGNQFAAQKR